MPEPAFAPRTLVARTVREADTLADRGELATGDARLAAGLRQAGQLLVEDRPEAVELLLRFHHALTCYSQRHGVSLETYDAAVPPAVTPSPGTVLRERWQEVQTAWGALTAAPDASEAQREARRAWLAAIRHWQAALAAPAPHSSQSPH